MFKVRFLQKPGMDVKKLLKYFRFFYYVAKELHKSLPKYLLMIDIESFMIYQLGMSRK